MKRLTIMTFKDSEASFLKALEDNNINYARVAEFTQQPVASGRKFSVFANLSEAMPWSALAKVIVAWITAKSSRQVNVTLEGHGSFMARGYSVEDVEKVLSKAVAIAVIDTKSDERAPEENSAKS
jgi:hypothetical protein